MRARAAEPHGDLSVTMLVRRIDSGGGIARSVSTLANSLARRARVEIISAERSPHRRAFPLKPSVDVTYVDESTTPDDSLDAVETGRDPRVAERIAALTTDVLIANNPRLAIQAAQHVRDDVTLIAREHSAFDSRATEVLTGFRRHAGRIDAVVALTEADRESHARSLSGLPTPVLAIPNALPWPVASELSTVRSPLIVTAGTLVPNKGHSRLIAAFAPLAERRPDWRLHIYGRGPEHASLQDQIDSLGLRGRIELMGFTRQFKGVLDHASLFALASHYEGFGMVLVEAMSRGLPVVSFDCPTGPRHVISHGSDGLLVPDGDVAAMTEALDSLIVDPGRRAEMATAALGSAGAYEPRALRRRWLRLFDELSERTRSRARRG
jgi:glycosyltransferase involved in cell wall biosynthesis